MGWFSAHGHTDASLLDGSARVKDVVKRVKELGQKSLAITDHGNLSNVIQLWEHCKKHDVKPIAAIEFYVDDEDENNKRSTHHLCVLAKNLDGYKSLLKLVSESNRDENFYYKPRVTFDLLKKHANGNLLAFSGHAGSRLAQVMISTPDAYGMSYEDAKKCLVPDLENVLKREVDRHIDIFGRENFFLEIQLFDSEKMECQKLLSAVLRRYADKHGIKKIATTDAHYVKQEDAVLQRIMLCANLKTTFKKVQEQINEGEFGLECFFRSDRYYYHSEEEMRQWHTEDEIENLTLIDSMIESYDIMRPPQLPQFGQDDMEPLKQICRRVYKVKIVDKNYPHQPKEVYEARVKEELAVIKEFGLASYFLTVCDYINWARQNGILVGPGRGSAGGSLVCYLLGITEINPLQYDLLFARFLNKARIERGSLPDIDTDFMVERREEVVEYLVEKYGRDRVAQIATFLTFKARAAVTEVLRVYGACDFDTIKHISGLIPQENTLSEEFEEMKADDLEQSAILYTVINNEALHEYVQWDGNKFTGEFAEYFSLAMRLEGLCRGIGKHAAGVIVGSETLDNFCPLVRESKGTDRVCGFNMGDAEKAGLVKFDILGVAALDKIALCHA